MRVYAKFGDIASMAVVNPTPCPELKRQINTVVAFPPAAARSLPTVRLCRMYSRREHPIRWTRHSYRSNIRRLHSPPDITMGCTLSHHAQSQNRSRVRYPTPTSPLVILLLLPRLLPRAPVNQSSCRSLSTATLSRPPQTLTRSRRSPPAFPMDPSHRASVQSHPSLTASRVSLAPSTPSLGALTSIRPSSIRIRDANPSTRPLFFLALSVANPSCTQRLGPLFEPGDRGTRHSVSDGLGNQITGARAQQSEHLGGEHCLCVSQHVRREQPPYVH